MAVEQKYAESLFEVSKNNGVEDSVFTDLNVIAKTLKADNAFKLFSEDPKVSTEKRLQFVDTTFKGVDQPLMNLFKILAERKQLGKIPVIRDAFEKEYNEAKEQQYMKVESVYKLSDEELDAIGKVFIERTGYKKLLIENIINESLIGGIRATIGTTVYDGSIINELSQLEKSFHQQ